MPVKLFNTQLFFILFLGFLLLRINPAWSQTPVRAFFADGFHGGVYGHFPKDYTRFMVDQLKLHPDWKINLEIEPETWDSVKLYDPMGYQLFQTIVNSDSACQRLEFVNPTYAQPYGFNISGESMIRQFQYGIKKLKSHFPDFRFLTYSSEEPCFTSCLPSLLQSLDCKYLVLKNPDTGWGGYSRAMGSSFFEWQGSDGSRLPTVPRYGCEYLKPGSTWQTMAWTLSKAYLDTCLAHSVSFPAGMCYQDAGWRNGPWLKSQQCEPGGFQYICWNTYFKQLYTAGKWPVQHLTQEDFQVSLVWGALVLQQLAQQVRSTENLLIQTEKIASLQDLAGIASYPTSQLDEAWRMLMLSQHHDCWIVPYNHQNGITWAKRVGRWTSASDTLCYAALNAGTSLHGAQETKFVVFNTLPVAACQLVTVPRPASIASVNYKISDGAGKSYPVSLADPDHLIFLARVPAMGFQSFTLLKGDVHAQSGTEAHWLRDGTLELTSDIYRLIIDPAQGGCIRQILKKGCKEDFVSQTGFNCLKGYLPEKGQWINTAEDSAKVTILENGPLRVRIAIEGSFAGQTYRQHITLEQGQPLIRCDLAVYWKHPPLIGAFDEGQEYRSESLLKAFYNDYYKLHLMFPVSAEKTEYYRDAPFDVFKSHLEHTFFNQWDSIKNNVILHWLDAYQPLADKGVALFSDHTTSCQWGANEPVGLTVQYIGKGLWGRFYGADTITRMHYAILPHQGDWNRANLEYWSSVFNEPLQVTPAKEVYPDNFSLIRISNPNVVVSSITREGQDLLIRLFNGSPAQGDQKINLNLMFREIQLVSLSGKMETQLSSSRNKAGWISVKVPFTGLGIRTLRIVGCQLNKF